VGATKAISVVTITAKQHELSRAALTPGDLPEQHRIILDALRAGVSLAGNQVILDWIILRIGSLPHLEGTNVIMRRSEPAKLTLLERGWRRSLQNFHGFFCFLSGPGLLSVAQGGRLGKSLFVL